MSKQRELGAHEMQDRNNRNAATLPNRDEHYSRNERIRKEVYAGMERRQADAASVPTQLQRLESPLLAGKKTVDTVENQLNQGKGKK